MNLRLFCLCVVGWAICNQGYAQPDERGLKRKADSAILVKGNTYAIIIGLSNYKNVTHLQYADKDAEAFERFLLSDAGGKVPAANVETFLNENASKTNIGDAISVMVRKTKPGDRVYFFFAGHGDMEDLTQIENGLLLLYNSPNGNYFGMNDDVLEILDLKRYLSPLAQRGIEMIFIVDACHSGNLKGGVEGIQQTAAALSTAWGKEYKILSCQPNQFSLESAEWGGGRGLFSLELEEGLKGLADMDNNGTISMFELQSYIQANVAKYSEGKQIPFISGDLSKPIATVNPAVLAALKQEKAKNYPVLASANTKGNEDRYIDSLDPVGKNLYFAFKKNLEEKKLVEPEGNNAFVNYRVFEKKYPDNPLTQTMRRNLAVVLNEKFNDIVSPLLKGETSYSTREQCHLAATELDSCLHLLGEQHYMYSNLKARKLFMDAMALTWALSANEFTPSLKPSILKAIHFLEESEQLEPNAAYTVQSLGFLYSCIFDYDKATPEFQKYLDLRPNDFYSKYSLALIFTSLKQYAKAEDLLEKLIRDNPTNMQLYAALADTYFSDNKKAQSFDMTRRIIDSLGDKANGYFYMGIYYNKLNKRDSAIHYYKSSLREGGDSAMNYNNIGQIFFVNNMTDSATHYFKLVLAKDSTSPFPNFNLGTIAAINGDVQEAIREFSTAIAFATPFDECFVTHMELYFKKKYDINNQKAWQEFRNTSFRFNFQYLGYLSIFYIVLRDPALLTAEKVDFIFNKLFEYKQHDAITWYHYACYQALVRDTKSALESIEKALKAGFSNQFLLTSDADLAGIRNDPAFKALLKRYFR